MHCSLLNPTEEFQTKVPYHAHTSIALQIYHSPLFSCAKADSGLRTLLQEIVCIRVSEMFSPILVLLLPPRFPPPGLLLLGETCCVTREILYQNRPTNGHNIRSPSQTHLGIAPSQPGVAALLGGGRSPHSYYPCSTPPEDRKSAK